jgi:hypothetical protein
LHPLYHQAGKLNAKEIRLRQVERSCGVAPLLQELEWFVHLETTLFRDPVKFCAY